MVANTSPVNWSTATYTFTPTRTGVANISFYRDVSRVNTGFSAAYVWVKFNPGGGASTTTLGVYDILFDSEVRRSGQTLSEAATVGRGSGCHAFRGCFQCDCYCGYESVAVR